MSSHWYSNSFVPDSSRPSAQDVPFSFTDSALLGLEKYVTTYWKMRWSLPFGVEYQSLVVPTGSVSIVFERNEKTERVRGKVVGPTTASYKIPYVGHGEARGITFHPAGFYVFFQKPLSDLRGKVVSFVDLFGEGARALEAKLENVTFEQSNAIVSSFLEELRSRDYEAEYDRVVEFLRSLRQRQHEAKLSEIRDEFGENERQVQRLFLKYVGLSPKQIVRIIRFQATLELLNKKNIPNWAQIALDLGYYDQAHFNKEFRRITGKRPSDFTP